MGHVSYVKLPDGNCYHNFHIQISIVNYHYIINIITPYEIYVKKKALFIVDLPTRDGDFM